MSISVIYRFIVLRHEITEICSVNRKHRSNRAVTLRRTHGMSHPITTKTTAEMTAGLVFLHNVMIFAVFSFGIVSLTLHARSIE